MKRFFSYIFLVMGMYCLILYIFHTDLLHPKHTADEQQVVIKNIYDMVNSRKSKQINSINKQPQDMIGPRNSYRQLKETSQDDIENLSEISQSAPGQQQDGKTDQLSKVNKINETKSTEDAASITQINISESKRKKDANRHIENVFQDNFKLNGINRFSDSNEAVRSCRDTKCSILSRIINRKFQQVSGNQMYVYSAFYDQRNESAPLIHIITLEQNHKISSDVPVTHEKSSLKSEGFVCVINTPEGNIESLANQYEMCENHEKMYGGFIYSCPLPTKKRLYKSSLSKVRVKAINSNNHFSDEVALNLTSTVLTNDTKAYTLGLCIPPLFGDIPVSLIIQFIEFHRLVGVSHFTFYVYEVSSNLDTLLKYYVAANIVTLIYWSYPSFIRPDHIWNHGQILSIQDCLYRHMAHFQYLGFLDLDEFIVPVHLTSLEQVLRLADQKEYNSDIAGFSFQSGFFNPTQVPDASQRLTFLQLLERTQKLSTVRTKVFVKPEKIFEVGIHHVSKLMHESTKIVNVDPNTAKVHHYRPCVVDFEADMNCEPTVRDEGILKFSDGLENNYKKVVKDIIKLFV